MQLVGRKYNILEVHFGSIFLLFPIKEVRDYEHSGRGNFQPLAPPLVTASHVPGNVSSIV